MWDVGVTGDLIKVMRLSLVSKAAVAKQRRYILLDNVLLWAGYASKKSKKLVRRQLPLWL